ncbi:MAG TPA: CmcJ/NvfI family oxidoreductase [Stellaceae bacterium]|nr:CmcJ/NvfI family oxidoreductase [Stellaceae bacterium]
MVQLAELDAERETLDATLNYFVDTKEMPVSLVGAPGESDKRVGGGDSEPHRVSLRNGRRHAAEFALERNGFRFVDHHTRVADFYDEDEIRRVYYPEMEALVKAEAGARRVVVFDHTLRTADDELRQAAKIREVVRRVHNDYTEWSGPQRVRDLMGGEAEELLRHRFAVIQTWRPIRHPVESWPLAIADARSLSPDDLVVTERRYPDRIGQTSAITWNPDHRWYWFPRMRPDEALVFKTFESLKDGRARFTAHTAFEDPTTPANARPRESIEIRTLAFF